MVGVVSLSLHAQIEGTLGTKLDTSKRRPGNALSSPGTRRGVAMLLPIRLDTDRVPILIPMRQGMTLFHRPLSSADGFIQPENPANRAATIGIATKSASVLD